MPRAALSFLIVLSCVSCQTATVRGPQSAGPNAQESAIEDIVFFAMGDPQYGGGAPDKNTFQITAMNTFTGAGTPRGVLVAGDLTQNGRDGRGIRAGKDEIGAFIRDYGLTGEDGLLRFPVYEGYGNHDFDADEQPDGFGTWRWFYSKNPTPAVRAVTDRNRNREGPIHVAATGDHYSWDWGPVHFVNLNLCAADRRTPGKQQKHREPNNSRSFLKSDLATQVGDSGRPVIIMQHYGLDRFGLEERWWTDENRTDFRKTIDGYNVVAIIHGHTHNTSRYLWQGYDVYNVGSPYYRRYNRDGKGHFTVFRISTDGRMSVRDVGWSPDKKGQDPNYTGWFHEKPIEFGDPVPRSKP